MTFRVLHRYLGYFLAGIMMVYALSGITLIFRKTDSFKVSVHKEITVEPGLDAPTLGEALRIRNLLPTDNDGTVMVFEQGRYCLLYTSPSPRDVEESRMPSSA